jgi:hypothetical protein
MLFYSALHWIDAYLAGKNFHPATHTIRDDEVENNGSLSAVFNDYRRLKDLSRAARYEIPSFGEDKLAVARNRLFKIKQHISGLFGLCGAVPHYRTARYSRSLTASGGA